MDQEIYYKMRWRVKDSSGIDQKKECSGADQKWCNPPREVRVRTKVIHVIDVNKQAQTFTVVVQFEASWIDEEVLKVAENLNVLVNDLKINEEETSQAAGHLVIEKDKTILFAPRLRLRNLIGKEDEEMWFRFYATEGEGPPVVCFRWQLKGVFQEVMELKMFPFDIQYLAMELEAGWEMGHQTNGVLLVKNQNQEYKSICNTLNFVQASEYHLSQRILCKTSRTPPHLSASGAEYAALSCNIRVSRKSGYWWWNVIVPMFIVTSCLFASYGVPPDNLADRSSITITLLLAMVAFKFVVSAKLPDIGYATIIDKYVLVCFFVALIIIALQVSSALGVVEEPFLQYQINRTAAHAAQAAKQNATNSSPLRDGQASAGFVILPGPGVRTVHISMHLVWIGSVWLTLHLLAIPCFIAFLWYRTQKASFWQSKAKTVWLGPLNFADKDTVIQKVRSIMEKCCKTLENDKSAIADVILWEGEEAQKCVEKFSGDSEPYRQKLSFAVVSFVYKEGAEKVSCTEAQDIIQEAYTAQQEDTNNKGPWKRQTRAEHLDPAYLVLRY